MQNIRPFLLAILVVTVTSVAIMAMKVVNRLWIRPKKYEKSLRDQGFLANPYRLLQGDMLDFAAMSKENRPKQIKLSDDVSSHALPYNYSIIKKYGRVSKQLLIKLNKSLYIELCKIMDVDLQVKRHLFGLVQYQAYK